VKVIKCFDGERTQIEDAPEWVLRRRKREETGGAS
jgi:hypothetical protein